MILEFADPKTLRLVITSGLVAPETVAAATRGYRLPDGRIGIESPRLTRDVVGQLESLGVAIVKEPSAELIGPGASWAQWLPLERLRSPPTFNESTVVLFELARAERLPELVTEMLRLGNDRQSFRVVDSPDEADVHARGLLRVVGPPYYTLLRALDSLDGEDSPIAFLEAAERIWLPYGLTHPLVDLLRPPKGKLLLIEPHRWRFVEEAPFHDVYEMVDIALPSRGPTWEESAWSTKLEVPLRLAPAARSEAAELWVLNGQGRRQLDRFVAEADDELLDRFAFAVGLDPSGDPERETVVLRVRPSKRPLPVLVLDAVAYHSYLKIPNLFVPVGKRIHPPLRRDMIQRRLAADGKRIVWLRPDETNQFAPESLPETAFRPLSDWVDYVLDREATQLDAWASSNRFEFESFLCTGDATSPERSAPPRRKRPQPSESPTDNMILEALDEPDAEPVPEPNEPEAAAETPLSYVAEEPDENRQRLAALEREFLAIEGPADDPERLALWPRMAALNTALGHTGDATVSWLNGIWEQVEPSEDLLDRWFRAESQGRNPAQIAQADLEAWLAEEPPMPANVRQLAAWLTWAAERRPPAWLASRLGRIQSFLALHEAMLPVRAMWLAWRSFARLAGDDALSLAQARDRVLERLFHNGLSPDQDLPSFLRASGLRTSDRFRQVRDEVLTLHQRARQWVGRCRETLDPERVYHGLGPYTEAFVDLIFALGLARLGEAQQAASLVTSARQTLAEPPPKSDDPFQQVDADVNRWLLEAYDYRIQQAAGGRTAAGALPATLLNQLTAWQKAQKTGTLYAIGQQRNASRILEPHSALDHYGYQFRGARARTNLDQQLNALHDEADPARISKTLSDLLAPATGTKHKAVDEASIVNHALQLAPRLGEGFSGPILKRVPDVLDRELKVDVQLELLQRAVIIAGHFDQHEMLGELLSRFRTLLSSGSLDNNLPGIRKVLAVMFVGLRKLGLRDEIAMLLNQAAVIARRAPNDSRTRHQRLELLLTVAAGWFYFGQVDAARPVIEEARAMLNRTTVPDNETQQQTSLACRYVEALGQAPVETVALPNLHELFDRLNGVKDNLQTMANFSQSQLNVVESVVLAMVSDEFTLDGAGRRWLDEDEYLVRRLIHADVRQMVGS